MPCLFRCRFNVQHINWFQEVVTGSAEDLPWSDDWDAEGPFSTGHDAVEVMAFYRAQCRRSNEILASTSPSAAVKVRHDGDPDFEIHDVRRVALHMIEETARHAGHADILRELIDGHAGR